MEIIIGREEGARRLHCIVGGREFNIGQAGAVPLSVSRRHCKISVNGSNISIENIKAQNVTFVDGNQVVSKGITSNSRVQLGEERFLVPLQQILQLAGVSAANGVDPQKEAPTFSLKPMKAVGGIRQPQNEDTERCCKICEQTTSARSILHVWYVSRLYSWHRPYNTHHHHCCSFVHRYIFLYKRKHHCNRSTTVARPRR